jgi:1-hydroxycarotenoid 3,4-desaturase
VVIVGAGVAGLSAALDLGSRGVPTVVVEAGEGPGGKLRRMRLGEHCFDSGPTVLTMRWVFEELFGQAGLSFDQCVGLRPASILARHAWQDGATLDLFADRQASADAIGRFAGASQARAYLGFCREAASVYCALEHAFLRGQRPSLPALIARIGRHRPIDLTRIRPFETLWQAVRRHFADPRLQQLFGRYATYCGSSPFEAPATLMLVAHVEQEGVWLVDEGMYRIAEALETAATDRGVRFVYGNRVARVRTDAEGACGVLLERGEILDASAVILNTDVSAAGSGLLGPDVQHAAPRVAPDERSLSAITWLIACETSGFPLLRHNVFFSNDYRAEFDALFARRELAANATVYVCAQDRRAHEPSASSVPAADGLPAHKMERLLCLVNAPAEGGRALGNNTDRAEQDMMQSLARFGLRLSHERPVFWRQCPTGFAQRYPGSGGAIYGSATHGWRATFRRNGARTRIPGLYMASGSVHPGPGVPMAALSGRLAVDALMQSA